MQKCIYIHGSSVLQIKLFKVTVDSIHDMIASAGAEICQTNEYHKTIENIALNKKTEEIQCSNLNWPERCLLRLL